MRVLMPLRTSGQETLIQKSSLSSRNLKPYMVRANSPHTTTAAMYDTIYITRHLVENMGLSGKPGDLQKDREKIRDGWANLKDYPGLSKTTIDENGEAVKDYYTLVVKNGEWIRLNQ